MAKAYRSDVVGQWRFQEEIQSTKPSPPLAVACPVTGCEIVYLVYDYAVIDADNNRAFLEYRLKREHAHHSSEIITLDVPPQRRV
jgi:hypothetical protein